MNSKRKVNPNLFQDNNNRNAHFDPDLDEKQKLLTKNIRLSKEKEHLLKLLDTLPVMVCLLNQDRHVIYTNKAFHNKFGEARGRHCYEYFFGQDKPCDFCQTYDVLKTENPIFWQCRAPDGKGIIDAYNFPFKDLDGSPLILKMDIDFTFKKRELADIKKQTDIINGLNKKLKAQYNELEAIYRYAPVGLCVFDDKLRYLKVNKMFSDFHKIPASDFPGKTVRDMAPNLADKAEALARKVLSTNRPIRDIEVSGEVPAEPGQKRYWLVSWYPIKNDREIIIVVAEDITEKKRIEKIKKKIAYQRIERLEKKKLANELHDTVSQLLFSSNLLSESLERSWKNIEPGKISENLEKIRKLNNTALSEMRILLYELMPKNIRNKCLNELIRDMAEKLCGNLNIGLDIKTTGRPKCNYNTKSEIYRIAQEAMSNIIKHSHAGKINIVLKENSGNLSLVISDNGVGFDKNDRSFRKNFGLNIMKDRANSIGASLNIESIPGKGTTLTLVKNL
jgi:PAS domain S-box-containing protein